MDHQRGLSRGAWSAVVGIEPKLSRWPSNRPPPRADDLEKALKDEGLSPFKMVDPPCTYYHTRSRSYTEVRWVLEGQLLIGLEDQEIVLGSGDRLDVPPGVKHYIRVLSEDGAVYLLASIGGTASGSWKPIRQSR
jgi:uncharacterized protein YjlB